MLTKIKFLTAGESHGRGLLGILDGIPSGLKIEKEFIDIQLARRQMGYGRGGRMKIEKDQVEIWSGIRLGETIASPIGLIVKNKDWENLALYIKKKFKKIDVLVNSAGVRLSGNLETTSMSDWSYHLNNNVTGTFLACKYILPFLKKAKNSSIINVASINSIRGAKNMLAYATSKSAIISFTASLALDLTKNKIRVNAVAPGAIETPMLASFKKDLSLKEYQKRMREKTIP